MQKSTAKGSRASFVARRPYKTTGVHLPADLWELLNRVAFERARTRGGRASVSALLVEMIERNRKALEAELERAGRLNNAIQNNRTGEAASGFGSGHIRN